MNRWAGLVTLWVTSVTGMAAIGPVSVQSIAAQAILSFTAPDPSQCLVQVYSDAALTELADDTNSTLFAGAQQCNRAGSAINGKEVSFVAGLRKSQKASDGLLHSRALAAQTTYYYVITDSLNAVFSQGSFTTATMALGNLYPVQPPFDRNAWDNRAYPQFGWTVGQRGQTLIDPVTGQLVKRLTFAGDAYAKNQNSTDGVGAQLANAVANGSCSNTANFNTSGASYGSCSGAATIFLPLPAFQMTGGGTFNNWYPRFNVDDLLLYVYGSADSTAIGAANGSNTLVVCLAQGASLAVFIEPFTVVTAKHVGDGDGEGSGQRRQRRSLRIGATRRCMAMWFRRRGR